jgi:hypothetical protein
MKTQKIMSLSLVVLLAGGMALSGCSPSKQARKVGVGKVGILGDYSMVREGKGNEFLEVYTNDKADWKKYTKVIIEPVKIQKPKKASEKELEALQKLVNNSEIFLRQELGKDYKIVTDTGSDTFRVRAAIFDAEKKELVGNTLSSLIPIGIGLSVVKDVAIGKPLSVGEITGEMKINDSQTNELLAAAMDRRVGQKYSKGTFDTWAEANHAIEYWMKRVRFVLCGLRGGSNCIEP